MIKCAALWRSESTVSSPLSWLLAWPEREEGVRIGVMAVEMERCGKV